MTHLHLDLLGGIAGDMAVAALADLAGLDSGELLTATLEVDRLGLELPPVEVTRSRNGGLSGLRVHVAPEPDPPSRSWATIKAMIEGAHLPTRARQLTLALFTELAAAEAQVHGVDIGDVHFHEVGAMDSIADLVLFSLLVEHLGVTTFSASAVPLSEGTVRTAHGMLPLPAPATTLLLEGFETVTVPGGIEAVTPTGATILATLCRGGTRPERATIGGTGTGLGSATLPDRPNALRVTRLEPVEPVVGNHPTADEATTVAVLECSIDDLDPRVYGRVAELLFQAGALDVFTTAIQMKKQRPGTLLTVLARPEAETELTRIILTETSTLGVRHRIETRTVLDRRTVEVDTQWGAVDVKLGILGDRVVNASPEYEECLVLAAEAGVPVKTVLATAHAAALEHLELPAPSHHPGDAR